MRRLLSIGFSLLLGALGNASAQTAYFLCTGSTPLPGPDLSPQLIPVFQTFVVPVSDPVSADQIRGSMYQAHYYPKLEVRIAAGGDGANINYYASPAAAWSWRCTELLSIRGQVGVVPDPLDTSLPAPAITGNPSDIERNPAAWIAQNGDIIYFNRYRVVAELPPGAKAELSNTSVRGVVGTGENALIAGFVVKGDRPMQAIVRVVGPSLAAFGVANPLQETKLELFHAGEQAPIATNTKWSEDTRAPEIKYQFHALAPTNPNESAILMELRPGAYTAKASGATGGTGVALIEVYLVGQF